jgi:enterochelin esterase-like enzyme
MEYLIGIDGTFTPDPANPRRARGPFGDKSVIEWPEYRPPAWLETMADHGPLEEVEIRCRRLVARVPVILYATPEPPGRDVPLLVVHDGPEYADFSRLTRFLEIAKRAPHGARLGMGASLGALAMLHAHVRHPGTFDGLLLQSGSFFRQRFDKHEARFGRYRRVTRFVGSALRDAGPAIPVALTCGTVEENRANNLQLAESLLTQGFPAWYADVRDAHNWTAWRDAFDPHLPALIEAAL